MVPGERISPNAIVLSSSTTKVPFGETLGVPSGAAVATNPSRCSSMTRLISGVSMSSCLKCRSRLSRVVALTDRPEPSLSRTPRSIANRAVVVRQIATAGAARQQVRTGQPSRPIGSIPQMGRLCHSRCSRRSLMSSRATAAGPRSPCRLTAASSTPPIAAMTALASSPSMLPRAGSHPPAGRRVAERPALLRSGALREILVRRK